MKKLLKYTLNNGTVPEEIEDGGYFYNEPYIYGISVHMEESYTPEGMEWVSQEELEALIAVTNENIPDDPIMEITPMSRENFESSHTPFSYKSTTPKDRITALEDMIAELIEGA